MLTKTRSLHTIATAIFSCLVWMLVGLFFFWSVGALFYLMYLPYPVRVSLAILFAVAIPSGIYRSENQVRTRAWVAMACVVVFLVTHLIRPSNNRSWSVDQAKVANICIDDGVVSIENFRHCNYRSKSDYDAMFSTRRFPLENIESVWFVVQKFSAVDGIAHVFLSFGLRHDSDPEYFSVSVEVRRESGETFSPLRGLFRTYELTHIVGDERDLIGVRTVHRLNDRVFMYRVNVTPDQARFLFTQFAKRIRSLRTHPQFYHTFLNNCMNGITHLTYELTPEPINWLDPRIVFPGNSAEFAFENGLIGDRANGQSFQQLETTSRIDVIARRVEITQSFSKDIRGSQSSN